jgi:hypothetical protein
MAVMKSRDYELLTREIFQQLLNQTLVPNIHVEHDVVKQGTKTRHQIDVYWEFTLGGIIYRTIVQAKDWAKPVDKGELLKFDSVLHDLPGQPRGIMVTTQGYQQGALEVARSCGILIYELKEEAPAHIVLNYTGFARYVIKGYRKAASGQPIGLVNEITIVNPEFSNLRFELDFAWVREGGTLALTPQPQAQPHELGFYDAEQRLLRTLREVYQDLAKEVYRRGETSAREGYAFDSPTFLKLPSTSSPVKVTSLSVDVTLKTERLERLLKSPNVAIFILRNLDDGTTLEFAKVPQG